MAQPIKSSNPSFKDIHEALIEEKVYVQVCPDYEESLKLVYHNMNEQTVILAYRTLANADPSYPFFKFYWKDILILANKDNNVQSVALSWSNVNEWAVFPGEIIQLILSDREAKQRSKVELANDSQEDISSRNYSQSFRVRRGLD